MDCSDWVPNTEPIAGSDHEPSFITTYSFPLNGSIFIRSFLSQATGTFRVSLDDQFPEDTASIEVIARGVVGLRIKDVAACLSVTSGEYSNLSLKAKGSSAESATYSISLRLPSRAPSYPGLVTDLPRFTQSFDEFRRRFDFLDIRGVNSDVSSVSLSAKFLSVRTSNGSIDGHFSADKQLDISGELKPITITSTICDDDSGSATFARISSSGSPINARLTLCKAIQKPPPNTEDESYGYMLYVANSDSPISLQVEHAVPTQGSILYLNVTNTETFSRGTAHTMVSLDSGFEGNFDVRATGTGTTPVSVQSEDATDDQGGIRYVEIERIENDKRSMSGKVFWDSPAPPLDRRGGNVYVSTAGDGEASLLFLGD